jgi:hypothetical protein
MEQLQKVPYHPGMDWGYCTSLTEGVLRWIILLNKRDYCWTSSDVFRIAKRGLDLVDPPID